MPHSKMEMVFKFDFAIIKKIPRIVNMKTEIIFIFAMRGSVMLFILVFGTTDGDRIVTLSEVEGSLCQLYIDAYHALTAPYEILRLRSG